MCFGDEPKTHPLRLPKVFSVLLSAPNFSLPTYLPLHTLVTPFFAHSNCESSGDLPSLSRSELQGHETQGKKNVETIDARQEERGKHERGDYKREENKNVETIDANRGELHPISKSRKRKESSLPSLFKKIRLWFFCCEKPLLPSPFFSMLFCLRRRRRQWQLSSTSSLVLLLQRKRQWQLSSSFYFLLSLQTKKKDNNYRHLFLSCYYYE